MRVSHPSAEKPHPTGQEKILKIKIMQRCSFHCSQIRNPIIDNMEMDDDAVDVFGPSADTESSFEYKHLKHSNKFLTRSFNYFLVELILSKEGILKSKSEKGHYIP